MYICGAAQLTYGLTALPAELSNDSFDGATTLDPAVFGIMPVATLYATNRYRWTLSADTFLENTDFTRGLERFYTDVGHKTCPASVLLRIERATLIRSIIACEDGAERRMLYETCRENDRAASIPPDDAELASADVRRFADEDWNCLYIGSAGSFNYGHWLVDDLPRARAAALLMRRSDKPVRIVLPSYGEVIDAIRVESLHLMLRANVHIDFVDPNVAQYFPALYFATPVTSHPLSKSPIAMDYVTRETVSALHAGAGVENDGQAQRIFVNRSKSFGRNILNEDVVMGELENRGFRVIDVDSMSFREQVETFSQASVVVGTMGAAMTNTLFCRPTTPVIHLAPEGWIEPFYFDLAMTRGHRYHVVYGAVDGSERPPHFSDFTVPVQTLTNFVDAL